MQKANGFRLHEKFDFPTGPELAARLHTLPVTQMVPGSWASRGDAPLQLDSQRGLI